MKIKEEHDERQKVNWIHNGNVTITPTAHIKNEGKDYNRNNVYKWNLTIFFFLLKAANNLKRASPIVQAHHRPAKIRPHYGSHMNDSLLSPNENHRDLISPEINSIRSNERAHIRQIEPKIDDG